MVITLPLIMILLDYWPLKRFESKKNKWLLWQLKEKIPFFVLSTVLIIITIYTPNVQDTSLTTLPLRSRLANVPVSIMTYLEKTFWPHDMVIFYPVMESLPFWQVIASSLMILCITAFVIARAKRLPFLFVGWLWFLITIAPVIGIIQISLFTPYALADRYHYLPSIGIATMLIWGIPSFIKGKKSKIIIFWTAAMVFLTIMAILTWQQCGYWKNKYSLYNHALQFSKENYVAHDGLGTALFEEGKIEAAIHHFSQSIQINSNYSNAYKNRGLAYFKQGKQGSAIEDFSEAIRLRPNYALFYYHRGSVYDHNRQYHDAIKDYDKAILLKRDADIYNYRGSSYFNLGQYQKAINDYNDAISIKQDHADAYNNRAFVYLHLGRKEMGCADARTACNLGSCRILDGAHMRGLCR